MQAARRIETGRAPGLPLPQIASFIDAGSADSVARPRHRLAAAPGFRTHVAVAPSDRLSRGPRVIALPLPHG